MKRITLIITVILASLILSACSEGQVVYEQPQNKLPATGKSWTVLIYMCGGSEETKNAAATNKLNEIMNVDYPENVNVAVQTGGSAMWHKKGVYSDYNQRFEAGKNTLYLADQAMAADMGDYHTLADFLSWGISGYKSDNYMLILSGAGGGSMNGMAFDENFDENSLNLEEISYAVSLTGKKFDVICLDASLMGSIETAAALSTYADYLVAPQSIQNPDTWDYSGMLRHICNNPSSGTADICKAICDMYYAKSERNGTSSETAMSVIDLSKISTLNQALDGMAGEMLVSTDQMSDYINMSGMISGAHIYGGATADEGYSNLIDIGDTAMKISGLVGNTADALIGALNDAVIYRVCGSNQRESTGLSMYYPIMPDNDELQNYMADAVSVHYKEFLRKTCIDCNVVDEISNTPDYTSSWAWQEYDNAMQHMEYGVFREGNLYELDIAGDMNVIKDVAMNVYKLDKNSGKYVFLGTHHDLQTNRESGIFQDAFSGRMPRLISKSVTIRLVKDCGDYAIYSIPVILNEERSNIRVKHDKVKDRYEIMGAWSGADINGKVTSSMISLKTFDKITPLLAATDREQNSTEYIAGLVGTKLRGGVTENNVENGEYMFEYEITDIYNHKRWGTPVHAKVFSGNVRYE
ncbi:MAG: hypothetical protein J1F01_05775 [Oscillospiraceae bacterium]|nr:hypothetical protein [Oscillospiraceae bacterium]